METVAITKLYNATLDGDEQLLLKLLHEDPLILERCIIEKSRYYTQSPLHVAVNMGHLHIINILLQKKPTMCDVHDQDGMTPLHVAANMGHSHIITILLQTKPNMCFVHDQDGMTPIHVAAINGKADVLKKLYDEIPHGFRERTNDGETVLHLCIKHNKMDVLEFLLDHVNAELLNSKDNDGNTILHLAVITNQSEMVKLLLKHKLIEINAINKNGLTAMDNHLLLTKGYQSYKDVMRSIVSPTWNTSGDEIGLSLKQNKALRAKDSIKMQNKDNWVENQSNSLMVVASLIATMAFQIGVNPPGGLWQDDGKHKDELSPSPVPHDAGDAIKDSYDNDFYEDLFHQFVASNTIALISSLSVILLLISGLPKGRLFVGILRITMWISITATTTTYAISLILITWDGEQTSSIALQFWLSALAIMVAGHALLLLIKFINRRPALREKIFKKWPPRFFNIIGIKYKCIQLTTV